MKGLITGAILGAVIGGGCMAYTANEHINDLEAGAASLVEKVSDQEQVIEQLEETAMHLLVHRDALAGTIAKTALAGAFDVNMLMADADQTYKALKSSEGARKHYLKQLEIVNNKVNGK